MAALSVLVAAVSVASAMAGIYPEDYWDYATKITPANADKFVKTNVDAGKTAPSWNQVAKAFASNEIAFGDVLLKNAPVKKIHGEDQNAGQGGWPTIRYFNKETGYGGKAYIKKTKMQMCEELGPKEKYMRQFVEEAGGTLSCRVKKPYKGCSDAQKTFIEKWSAKSAEERQKQFDRVQAMVDRDESIIEPEALLWAKQRLDIFKQLKKAVAKDEF